MSSRPRIHVLSAEKVIFRTNVGLRLALNENVGQWRLACRRTFCRGSFFYTVFVRLSPAEVSVLNSIATTEVDGLKFS